MSKMRIDTFWIVRRSFVSAQKKLSRSSQKTNSVSSQSRELTLDGIQSSVYSSTDLDSRPYQYMWSTFVSWAFHDIESLNYGRRDSIARTDPTVQQPGRYTWHAGKCTSRPYWRNVNTVNIALVKIVPTEISLWALSISYVYANQFVTIRHAGVLWQTNLC